jgi:hypothetical protein
MLRRNVLAGLGAVAVGSVAHGSTKPALDREQWKRVNDQWAMEMGFVISTTEEKGVITKINYEHYEAEAPGQLTFLFGDAEFKTIVYRSAYGDDSDDNGRVSVYCRDRRPLTSELLSTFGVVFLELGKAVASTKARAVQTVKFREEDLISDGWEIEKVFIGHDATKRIGGFSAKMGRHPRHSAFGHPRSSFVTLAPQYTIETGAKGLSRSDYSSPQEMVDEMIERQGRLHADLKKIYCTRVDG